MINLKEDRRFQLWISFLRGRFLMTGKGCKPQAGLDVNSVKADSSSRYFFYFAVLILERLMSARDPIITCSTTVT